MTPDPDVLRRVLMNVAPQPVRGAQGMPTVAQGLPPGPQVNLNPALARQMALVAALRQRR